MTTTASTTTTTTTPRSTLRTVYVSLVGLAGLLVLLQGLWAGLFVHEGRDYKQSWVDVHARGADIAIILTVVAAVLVWVKLRQRRDLAIGTTVFAVLLVLEAWIGGRIGGSPGMTVVHFPLAMALMALSVWLPLRATNR